MDIEKGKNNLVLWRSLGAPQKQASSRIPGPAAKGLPFEFGSFTNLRHSFRLKLFRKLDTFRFLDSVWLTLRKDLLVLRDKPIFFRCNIHCWSFKGSSSKPSSRSSDSTLTYVKMYFFFL